MSFALEITAEKNSTQVFMLCFVSQVAGLHAKLLVQIKDQQWVSEFVDLQEDQDISPDHSVLNVILIPQADQMLFFFFG